MIITIMSCKKNISRQKAIRETWLKDLKPPHQAFFFVGDSLEDKLEEDTIHLKCPDDYRSLPIKQFKCLEFINNNFDYDYTFNCDDDTYVVIDRLLNNNFKDYVGYPSVSYDGSYRYAYGGSGFILSKNAISKMMIFKDSKIVYTHPWADSLFGLLATILKIDFTQDLKFNMGKYNNGIKQLIIKNDGIEFKGEGTPIAIPNKTNNLITSHFINEENFYKIYNHFYGEEKIENKYIIKSEFTGIDFIFKEIEGKWYYEFNNTKEGPFEYLEYAEHHARKKDELWKRNNLISES